MNYRIDEVWIVFESEEHTTINFVRGYVYKCYKPTRASLDRISGLISNGSLQYSGLYLGLCVAIIYYDVP
jgi:hypothetical protein